MKQKTDKNLTFYICLALALATLGVYWQVHRYAFVNFDDYGYVRDNPHVQYGFTAAGVKWAFSFSGYASNWHPLTWLSHMLDCQLFDGNAGMHHLTNLFLHIANTLILFIVLKQATSALWQSAFVAALFALHPLHVESVAWIAERKDVLSTFFWMLTMWAYVRYVKRPKVLRYSLIVIFLALGLMAKPMLVTLPFVLFLLDYWPLERFGKRTVYQLIFEKIPLFVLSAASSVITFIIQKRAGAVIEINRLPLSGRIANTFLSYVNYIWKMILPRRLAVFYPHSYMKFSTPHILAAAILLLGITAAVICLARKRKYLAVGWLWYLGTLVPVIGLVQVGGLAMADRYTYIPLTGLFIIIAWWFNDLLIKWKYRKIMLGLSAGAVLAAMALCTWFQAGYWENSRTLFNHTVAITTKDNYVAQQCLADALREEGKIEQAIEHYHKVLQIYKNFVPANVSLGSVLIDTEKYDEAIKYLTRAVELNPRLSKARPYGELARAMAKTGKINEALSLYEKAHQLEPDWVIPINSMAWYLATYNDEKVRNPAKAVRLAQQVCELTNYKQPEFLDTLAVAYAAAGDFVKAIETTNNALKLCQSPKQESLRKEIESRLVLFEAGKGYIENE